MKKNEIDPQVVVLCGIGEKRSNGGTQWFEQDRIYSVRGGLATSIPAESAFHPWYMEDYE